MELGRFHRQLQVNPNPIKLQIKFDIQIYYDFLKEDLRYINMYADMRVCKIEICIIPQTISLTRRTVLEIQ